VTTLDDLKRTASISYGETLNCQHIPSSVNDVHY